jgi:hypothetical protein
LVSPAPWFSMKRFDVSSSPFHWVFGGVNT